MACAILNKISVTVVVDTGAGMSTISGSFYDDFLLRSKYLIPPELDSSKWTNHMRQRKM